MASAIKILLAEDNEDDHFLFQRLLGKSPAQSYELDWAKNFDEARELINQDRHDVYLFDSKLGGGTGTDLLRELIGRKSRKPVILLAGAHNTEIDKHAIELGAADYLVKGDYNSGTLMRSIRYAIERKQIEAVLRKESERRVAIIATQQAIATSGKDMPTTMRVICEQAQALTEADGGVMELAEGDEMVYRAVSGINSNQLGLRLKIASSLSGLCVTSGKSLKCDDCETDLRVDREACRRIGIRSMIVVPLQTEALVEGVLKVISKVPNHFTESDLQNLQLMAGLMAAALKHGRQLAEKEKLIADLCARVAKPAAQLA